MISSGHKWSVTRPLEINQPPFNTKHILKYNLVKKITVSFDLINSHGRRGPHLYYYFNFFNFNFETNTTNTKIVLGGCFGTMAMWHFIYTKQLLCFFLAYGGVMHEYIVLVSNFISIIW